MALTKEDLQAIGALLEPIRADIQDLKTGQKDLQAGQKDLQAGQKDLQEQIERVRHSVVNIELEQYPRIAAAMDGYKVAHDKNKEQDERITYLEQKTDYHDTRFHEVEAQIKKAL